MVNDSPKSPPLAAIVLAAGKGTRMKSRMAKVLHEAGGRPLAYYPVRRALDVGADPVVVVVGHQAREVEQRLSGLLAGSPVRFAVQAEQLGTAHAVLAARDALRGFEGEVAILSGDTPLLGAETLRRVVEAKRRSGATLAVATMRPEAPAGYGRVVRDGAGRPSRIVEEKDATPEERRIVEVNAGLYCADAAFLWAALARVGSANAQGEFYLTDLVAMAAQAAGCVAAEVSPLEAAGVNDRVELARAGRELLRRKAEALMRAGVTIVAPERFECDEDVEVAPDTVIEADVRLAGATRIGSGCAIGQGSILRDALLGDDVKVKPYTVIEKSSVAAKAELGPFARLRPASEVMEGAHVGNFVELKKTRLGKGSKANHLAYLGDSDIGQNVNVGAGTITCNYDGKHKHKTQIGDGAFVGSDSILVAPITIGAGAYVAAGSTLTDPVPPGALALGRARQVVKEGWAAKSAATEAEARKDEPAKPTGGAPGGRSST
jgi:bifunctional UDP-N-acetylglucosamine pyrophosphorylase / glucosamine-1-phosphate N-acetyltransferase